MNWVLTTKVIIMITIVFLVNYDLVALWFGGKEASITHVCSDFVREFPIVAILIGIVIGHILWRD